MTLLLNAEITITRNPDAGGQVMYGLEGFTADPTLQFSGLTVAYPYVIATPANPSLGIFATLASAQVDFIANQLPPLVSIINSAYPSGPTYTGIGNVKVGNNASAAVSLTIGGAGVQPQDPTRTNLVIVSLNETESLSLTGGQTGTISFQTSTTLGGTYSTESQVGNSNTGTLVIGLNTVAGNGNVLVGIVPVGSFYKIIASGTGTNTVVTAQETTL